MYNSGDKLSFNDVQIQRINKVVGTITVAAEAAAGTETVQRLNGETMFVGYTGGTFPGTSTLDLKLTDADSYGLVSTGSQSSSAGYFTGTAVPMNGDVAVSVEISGTIAKAFDVPYIVYYTK